MWLRKQQLFLLTSVRLSCPAMAYFCLRVIVAYFPTAEEQKLKPSALGKLLAMFTNAEIAGALHLGSTRGTTPAEEKSKMPKESNKMRYANIFA